MGQFVAADAYADGAGSLAAVQFGRAEVGAQFDFIKESLPVGLFGGILDAPVVGPDGVGISPGGLVVTREKEDA